MASEEALRGLIFFVGLILFTLSGVIFAFRKVHWREDLYRWINNLALTFSNSILVQFAFPISLLGVCQWASSNNLGLFNQTTLPPAIEFIASLLILDLLIYLQHLVFHKVPLLWRLHRVHHSDVQIDTSTALRFHPIEIAISWLIKGGAALLFGISPLALLTFEVVLNFSAMFNHSNFALWPRLEKFSRGLIVTPDMHRIHHSLLRQETDSNYGFCLSIWDRIFKTYTSQSKMNLQTEDLGQPIFRSQKEQRLDKLWTQPFRKGS